MSGTVAFWNTRVIVLHILSMLPLVSRVRMASVNQLCKQYAYDAQLWKSLDLRGYGGGRLQTCDFGPLFCRIQDQIKYAIFDNCSTYTVLQCPPTKRALELVCWRYALALYNAVGTLAADHWVIKPALIHLLYPTLTWKPRRINGLHVALDHNGDLVLHGSCEVCNTRVFSSTSLFCIGCSRLLCLRKCFGQQTFADGSWCGGMPGTCKNNQCAVWGHCARCQKFASCTYCGGLVCASRNTTACDSCLSKSR